MPFEGFKALKGSNGPKLFTIDNVGEPESLPRCTSIFPLFANILEYNVSIGPIHVSTDWTYLLMTIMTLSLRN